MVEDTRTLLIETAMAQVRRQGYAGFSYADLATAVGIRKASIHHHFPTKEDLGVALVEAYTKLLGAERARITAEGVGAVPRLRAYATLYSDGLPAGLGCLCGVLTGELAGLPE